MKRDRRRDRGRLAQAVGALCALCLWSCGSATLRNPDGGGGGKGGGAGSGAAGSGAAGSGAAGSGAAGSGAAGAAGGAGATCGARGQPCCAGAICAARASCDGTTCIAADVWASELDGTFDFNGGTWSQPIVSGTTSLLPAVNALWGTSATFVIGVGTSGLIVQNQGSGWQKQKVGDGTETFLAVAGAGASDVWAVGDASFAHFNGTSWSVVAPPSGANGNPFQAVWLSGPGAGWAVGTQGVYAQLSGGTWTFIGHSSNGVDYNGVWGSAANDVYIVGNSHSIAAVGNPLLISHYDGSTWNDMSNSVDPNSTMPPLNAIWGADATHVWAVGEGGTVVLWNGSMWTPQLTGAGSSESLHAVWGSGARDVWVAGSAGVRHFNGTAWSPIPGLTAPVAIWLSQN